MSANLTDKALESLHTSGEGVNITLRDGSSLSGKVVDFDGYILMLSGNPDVMVYRHSILKLVPASVSAVTVPVRKPQRPSAVKQARAEAPRKTQTSKPRKQAPPRREQHELPKPAAGETGFSNPMADAMQKWLKSQKGGG